MKKLVYGIIVFSLAACGQAETEAEPEVETVEAGEAPTPGMQIVPGLYAVGDETTVYGQTRLNADGTYVDLAEGEEVGSGTWTADGVTMCLDPEGDGEDEQERCWTNGAVAEDGSFMSTRDDGSQSYRVTPISE